MNPAAFAAASTRGRGWNWLPHSRWRVSQAHFLPAHRGPQHYNQTDMLCPHGTRSHAPRRQLPDPVCAANTRERDQEDVRGSFTTFPDHEAVTSPGGVSSIIRQLAPVVSDMTCFHAGAPGPWGRTKTSVRNPKAILAASTGDPLSGEGDLRRRSSDSRS